MPYENKSQTALDAEFVVPSLRLNPDDYRQGLAAFDMTKEQENELLGVLWQIMKTMVEIGWGVNSVQYLLPEIFEAASADSPQIQSTEPQKRSADDQ